MQVIDWNMKTYRRTESGEIQVYRMISAKKNEFAWITIPNPTAALINIFN
jgi:hypothetical protein